MTASAEFIHGPRFSRTFELAADSTSGRSSSFKVKYADYGYRNEAHPDQENVVLFFGSLMSTRLFHIATDHLAKKHRIRIIDVDRPGIGGTDPVHSKDLMNTWRGVLLALLQHLEIHHVSLACHSAGTIFAMDLLLHHPEILHPERSYLAIGGPWVLPTHTGSILLSIYKSFPANAMSHSDKIPRLINDHIGPFLGAAIGSCVGLIGKAMPSPQAEKDEAVDEMDGVKLEYQLRSYIISQMYAEGVKGSSAEMIVVMQKGMSGWSDWGDYDTGVPRLVELLRAAGKRLRVDVFYAENDWMIGDGGTKGPRWFDKC